MEEKYPQLASDQKMLEFLYRKMQEVYDRDEEVLQLSYRSGQGGPAYLRLYWEGVDVGEKIGVRSAEAISMFKRLAQAGYIITDVRPLESFGTPGVWGLTNDGLAQIGRLPDPQERLVLGLDAAIRSVQRDSTLGDEDKKRRIDWFEEAKIMVRTLGVETVKAVWRGDLPVM